jgi:hypothetical protein
MGSSRKRQQTIAKRNRERAVEEKRTLKRLEKQAKRAAARGEGEEQHPEGPEPPSESGEAA